MRRRLTLAVAFVMIALGMLASMDPARAAAPAQLDLVRVELSKKTAQFSSSGKSGVLTPAKSSLSKTSSTFRSMSRKSPVSRGIGTSAIDRIRR